MLLLPLLQCMSSDVAVQQTTLSETETAVISTGNSNAVQFRKKLLQRMCNIEERMATVL